MFDPIILNYQEFMLECEKTISTLPLKKATSAFLSSLTNKRIDWRSGIASHINLTKLLEHGDEYFYDIDEEDDINILNFERIKWGGVRHSRVLYNYIDLKILQTEIISEPTIDDINIFNSILLAIENSKPTDTASMLRDNLKNTWNVSKDERGVLLEILGCCGILETLDYDRKEPHRHDWKFVTFWRGQDKYNKQKVIEYFGEYIKQDVGY